MLVEASVGGGGIIKLLCHMGRIYAIIVDKPCDLRVLIV
jgi:hypothetical protein